MCVKCLRCVGIGWGHEVVRDWKGYFYHFDKIVWNFGHHSNIVICSVFVFFLTVVPMHLFPLPGFISNGAQTGALKQIRIWPSCQPDISSMTTTKNNKNAVREKNTQLCEKNLNKRIVICLSNILVSLALYRSSIFSRDLPCDIIIVNLRRFRQGFLFITT